MSRCLLLHVSLVFLLLLRRTVNGWSLPSSVTPISRPFLTSPIRTRITAKNRLGASTIDSDQATISSTSIKHDSKNVDLPTIVLVAGFESFNRQLYMDASQNLDVHLKVFSDAEIRIGNDPNPAFVEAVIDADIFIGSLIFDYDDVQVVLDTLQRATSKSKTMTRLIFESATELMQYNRVGTFSMMNKEGDSGPTGPPPAVKAILKRFSSGKEEDKLSGYLELLKFGPDLLKFVPGEKASDLRTWLEAYRYWNQSGLVNARSMLQLLLERCVGDEKQQQVAIPDVVITPGVGLLHPFRSDYYWTSPKEYLDWRLRTAKERNESTLLQAPRIAVLLYRKHVISGLRYINDLILQMEGEGLMPIPIFINGVEAHTIVRDLLTSVNKEEMVRAGKAKRESSFQSSKAVSVDAIVNTIGFPLVGGPAGSMEAGRNVDVAQQLLREMNVPYMIASPLLLQSITQWKESGVLGLQAVVLYSLPELDGAIDTVVLGGLVGDKIALIPERVRKLTSRLQSWIALRQTPPKHRKLSIVLYGFPPNVGAVGTAALLDVPQSLENLLKRLYKEGYDVGNFASDPHACGQSLVAALSILSENPSITGGAARMHHVLERRIERARQGDVTTAECLARDGGGLGGAKVQAVDISSDELEKMLGKYMNKKVRRAWAENDRGPGVTAEGKYSVAGLQLGNVFLTVQPLLGVEGDPMRLLFERDLTPHPQYCAAYAYMKEHSQAVLHLGMHGTSEWLPGQPLGNDRASWSDEIIGSMPNIYAYACNNPSESILAKRRGYGTLISYNVPPYGRAGLYMELANLKELVEEYRSSVGGRDVELMDAIVSTAQRAGMLSDVPITTSNGDLVDLESTELTNIPNDQLDKWIGGLSSYLIDLQNRLFSSGLRTLGEAPTEDEIKTYLEAYYGDAMTENDINTALKEFKARAKTSTSDANQDWWNALLTWIKWDDASTKSHTPHQNIISEATEVASLLHRSTEELDAIVTALDGGYVLPNPGGDLIRDGSAVLPTGRNIHALDPYRMPSAGAWIRGQKVAEEIIRQHRQANGGLYPETVAVSLWGLDAIKTRGESVAIVLALVGAKPVKEGTGRVVRFDLVPLEELGRPRIDILASLSGIFRDSFANIVDLLDDMFERAAIVEDETEEMNFIKKHASQLHQDGVERPAARLFSNPPGDYGSMVNEVVGSGDWEDSESLGETWKSRNSYSYGRNEGTNGGTTAGTARPEVLDKLLATTERVVQEVDSVEYGMTDIQEYYANTGALKKAAENRKPIDASTGQRKKVDISVIEAFSNDQDDVAVRNVEDVLRLEYRSKLLNPKWRDAMLAQGSGGAYEVSQRMTAMVGWAATAEVDNFVFDQAAERYALDEDVARQLQKNNPEAFKNVVRRLLEAAGRGMWSTNADTLNRLKDMYAEADDLVEQVR
ncbi:cobaltochelatase [Nitzschia inconspicua]|uniref:magnesium chelatase n=1 Tax=Nitzschia inconspicua TaxID=303405 RepID=A0A9K3PMZ7_9STRA|nr:cobaltochelatase [Nitzschia inconspicua]